MFVCHGYREHKSNIGSSIAGQEQKLSLFLDQRDRAINFGDPEEPNDLLVLCDMNLDSHKWVDPNYHLYSLAQLVHRFCNSNNIEQLVKIVTKTP